LIGLRYLKGDISIEEKRASLVDSKLANNRKEAEAKAFALQAALESLKQTIGESFTT